MGGRLRYCGKSWAKARPAFVLFCQNPSVELVTVSVGSIARVISMAALAVGLAVSAGSASTVSGLDRTEFAAEVSDGVMQRETFDSLQVGPISSTPTLSFSSTAGKVVVTHKFRASTGVGSLGGGALEYFLPHQTLTITFATAITAFGIDINSWATLANAFVGTTNTGESFGSVYSPFPGKTTGQFLGFGSSTPFTSITLAAKGNYTFTVDTLDYGKKDPDPVVIPDPEPEPEPSPVPLPASAALLAGALASAASLRRRSVRRPA